jgi:hypothetical protein
MEQQVRIQNLRSNIIHLDEVLTMSARMAAATGDPQWETRYREFETKLDAAIREAVALVPEAHAGEGMAETDAANIRLVEMENRSFRLVRQGRVDEAAVLLSSEEYQTQKRVYAQGMTKFAAGLASSAENNLKRQKQQSLLGIASVVLVLAFLIAGWLMVLRALRRWRTTLSENNRSLARQAEELAELNRSLDQKVAERTYDLGERVKELNCLYGISRISANEDASLEEILQKTVDLIPPALRYPEVAGARIVLEDQVFQTRNFKLTAWTRSSKIIVYGSQLGTLDVCYLEDRPQAESGPFLKEEVNLIETLVERLGKIAQRKNTEASLSESAVRLKKAQQMAHVGDWEWNLTSGSFHMSEEMCRIYGIPDNGAFQDLQSLIDATIHPDDKETISKAAQEVIESSAGETLTYRIVRPNRKP